MAQDITSSKAPAAQITGFDVLTPLSSRTLFWRPRFLRDGASLAHLPFLFWMMESLRPKAFVSLGGDAIAYFALCQAVEKLDLDARGYAFGPWPGDAGAVLPQDLLQYNEDQYADFSRLSGADGHAPLGAFREGSVDLLHICLPAEGVSETRLQDWIERDWTERLSDRAVIVLQGVKPLLEQDGFLARLMDRFPSFHLDAGNGLLLLLPGAAPEDRLAKLCTMRVGASGYAAVLQIFSRLGATIRAEVTARMETARADILQQRMLDAERMLAEVRVLELEQQQRLIRLNEAYDERNRQVALLQARLVDQQDEVDRRVAEARALETAAAQAAQRTLKAEAEALVAQAEERHQAQADRLAAQIADLTMRQAADRLAAEEAHDSLMRQISVLSAERDAMETQLAERERELAQLVALGERHQTVPESQDQNDRQQIAALLAERDALAQELQSLQAQVRSAEALAADTGRRDEEVARLARELETRQAEAGQQQAEALLRIRAFEAEREKLEAQVRALASEHSQAVAQLSEALAARQNEAAAREALLREVQQLKEEREMRVRQAEAEQASAQRALQEARAAHEDEVASLQALLRDRLSQVDQLTRTLDTLRASQQELQKERDQARTHARSLEESVSQILSSTSWKLTAPMRRLVGATRKGAR